MNRNLTRVILAISTGLVFQTQPVSAQVTPSEEAIEPATAAPADEAQVEVEEVEEDSAPAPQALPPLYDDEPAPPPVQHPAPVHHHARPVADIPDPSPLAEERATLDAQVEPAASANGIGFAVSAGAGVTGFSAGLLRDTTDIGIAWDVRVAAGTRKFVTLEAAYLGSSQRSDTVFYGSTLRGGGLETNARLNLGTNDVQPYAIGGIGWMHYTLSTNGVNVFDPNDDILTVPVGAGISYRRGSWLLDVRGTYRFAFSDELFQRQAGFIGAPGLDAWSFIARAGFEF